MKVLFAENAWEDYLHWQKTDKKVLKRINQLIRDIQRQPFTGIGNRAAVNHIPCPANRYG